MTKPAPKMPEHLPPLPMGKNGKPLVYLGLGGTFRRSEYESVTGCLGNTWGSGLYEGTEDDIHYASESDSEVCKLNVWGDFASVESKPDEKKTALQIYIEAAKSASEEAERNYITAKESADAWSKHLNECNAVLAQLVKSDALTPIERKQWYDKGRQDERRHAKVRTVFPLSPC